MQSETKQAPAGTEKAVGGTVSAAPKPHADFFSDSSVQDGHASRSLRGGVISIASRAINALVQVSSVIFLARMLTPEDYGLVAMVTALTGFAPMLVDLGTRDAVAQKEKITEQEISTLFWITIATGMVLSVVIAASGPLIAGFYGKPQLTMITLVSALTVVGSAIPYQHQALLRRSMRFRESAIIDIVGNVVGAGTAFTVAYLGYGYWALVWRPVATVAGTIVAAGYFCRWIPGPPKMTANVIALLRFGIHLVGYTILDFAGRSLDSVAIGRLYGERSLGYYRKALLIYDNSLDLTIALHSVASVSLSKLRGDPQELQRLWGRAISTLSFFAMPAFGGMAVIGQDLINVVLGPKWDTAGVVLSVLALRGIPHVVERTLGWLHIAAGRSDRWMRWGLISTGVQAVALFCGLPYGPMGIAWAYVAVMYLMFVPAVAYAGAPVGIRAADVLQHVWAPFLGTLLAVGGGFLLKTLVFAEMAQLSQMCALGAAYTVIYLAVVPGLLGVRKPLHDVRSVLPGARKAE